MSGEFRRRLELVRPETDWDAEVAAAMKRRARSDPWRATGVTVEYALARLGARVLRLAPWLARIAR